MSDASDRDSGRGQPEGSDHLGDELLSRLVDGDLGPDERRIAETHLQTCADCRENLDALRSTITLLRTLPAPRPSRSFQLAPAHARQASGWARFAGWLTPSMPAMRAAVVAIVLVIGGAAAFNVLRDDDEFTNSPANNMESEPTVAKTGETMLAATVENPPLVQAQATSPPPTATPDTSTSRSGQPVEVAENVTDTPEPTMAPTDEFEPISAAPDIAPTATTTRVPMDTSEPDSIFGIEEEPTQGGDSDEPSDAMTSDAPAREPTATDAAQEPTSDDALDESADQDGSDEADVPSSESAGATEADRDLAAEAPVAADESESSAAFAEPSPTATASPTPTLQPTNAPPTPPGSPSASPIASPVATPVTSPVVSPTRVATSPLSLTNGATMDTLTPSRIDAMLAAAFGVLVAALVMAIRATRRPGR